MQKNVNNESQVDIGSAEWNDDLFLKHPTPYKGIAGKVEYKRAKKIASIIKKHSKKGAKNIIEIGCEQGNLLDFLFSKLPQNNFFGTDISSLALKKAKDELDSSIVLIKNDITKEAPKELPVIDVLICSEVLEHIPEYEKAIHNINEIVTEETLIIITVPLEKHKNNIKRLLLKLGLFNLLFKGIEEGLSEWHVNDFSKQDITLALEKFFKVIDYKLLWFLHQMIVLKKKKNGK